MIASEGLPIQTATRVLGVSESGFYEWRNRRPSTRSIRHAWLTDMIRQVHAASRGTYGAPRVHAELTMGYGIKVGHNTVEMLMRRAGLKGLPGSRRPRRRIITGDTADDLVDRNFARTGPDQLWVTDITEHRTREGKIYCAVVLDVFSRRIVGWSIDSSPTSSLVTSALGMAINNRNPKQTVIHSDHGTQYTSWAFTHRARQSGLVPSMGSVGDCFDNAVVESFWARMQVELLNRQRWRTRIELANAIFEYIEIFHNRQRRHSSLEMRTPIEYEIIHHNNPMPALQNQAS